MKLNEYRYAFPITVDLGSLVPAVAQLTEDLNASMKIFSGSESRLSIRSEIGVITITSGPLSKVQLEEIRGRLQAAVDVVDGSTEAKSVVEKARLLPVEIDP